MRVYRLSQELLPDHMPYFGPEMLFVRGVLRREPFATCGQGSIVVSLSNVFAGKQIAVCE